MNRANKPSRGSHFYHALQKAIAGEARKYRKQQNLIASHKRAEYKLSEASRKITRDLGKQANEATRQLDIEADPNENTLIVHDLHTKRTVNKELMTCDCGVPLTRSRPCIHVFVMSNHERIPRYKLFNHDFYHVDKWQSQFPEDKSLDEISLAEVKQLYDGSALLKGVELLCQPSTAGIGSCQ
eukprot:gb/GECG01007388.1/.p1 GENE.gb/GECG01007388.1/~~gb/GECG01007388.1/.p1  ORF type:complete len:183 (+),score=17.49 gb/GECG01007388.1/:1-549(+)